MFQKCYASVRRIFVRNTRSFVAEKINGPFLRHGGSSDKFFQVRVVFCYFPCYFYFYDIQ
jgi:hypothetical protein